jgi:hypothetical protein
MAFLSGTHGEPQEPEDACDKCREKMRLYRVAPFYCAVDRRCQKYRLNTTTNADLDLTWQKTQR